MDKITASSVPVYSGENEWGLHEWVQWHKELVKKYNTQTIIVKKNGYSLAVNSSADTIWNKAYNKTSFNAKIKNNISKPVGNEFADDKKYLGMWGNLATFGSILMVNYDPTLAGIHAAGETAEAVYDAGKMIMKVALYGTIAVVSIGLVVASAYVYNSFKKKPQRY